MGEHKRREARKATARQAAPSGLTFAEIDELMGEDPDDRAIRMAHGFTAADADSTSCRNGCGATYGSVAAGKIHDCEPAAPATPDAC